MDWIAVLITFIGSTAFTSIISLILHRNAVRRLKLAEAKQAELEVSKTAVEVDSDKYALLERRCVFLEQSLIKADERDADKTAQIRSLNEKVLSAREENASLRIEYTCKRCDRKKCTRRVPPNGF